jgi:hypothetical protein
MACLRFSFGYLFCLEREGQKESRGTSHALNGVYRFDYKKFTAVADTHSTSTSSSILTASFQKYHPPTK